MKVESEKKTGELDNDAEKKDPIQAFESLISKIGKEKEVEGGSPGGKEKKDDSERGEPQDSKDASSKDEEKGKRKEDPKEDKPVGKRDGDDKKTESKDEKASDKKEDKDKKEDIKGELMEARPETPPPYGITPSEFLRLRRKKKNRINFIIITFFTLLGILIFITIGSIRYFIDRQKLNERMEQKIIITEIVQESPLKGNFLALKSKINKYPASKEDIDKNIAVLQDFVDEYSALYPRDEWVKKAKEQIRAQEELKMMY